MDKTDILGLSKTEFIPDFSESMSTLPKYRKRARSPTCTAMCECDSPLQKRICQEKVLLEHNYCIPPVGTKRRHTPDCSLVENSPVKKKTVYTYQPARAQNGIKK